MKTSQIATILVLLPLLLAPAPRAPVPQSPTSLLLQCRKRGAQLRCRSKRQRRRILVFWNGRYQTPSRLLGSQDRYALPLHKRAGKKPGILLLLADGYKTCKTQIPGGSSRKVWDFCLQRISWHRSPDKSQGGRCDLWGRQLAVGRYLRFQVACQTELRCNSQHASISCPRFGPQDRVISGLAVGDRHACVLRGGRVSCRGDDFFGQLQVPRNLGAATRVSAGHLHTCAALKDGGLRCWGNDFFGQSLKGQRKYPKHRVLQLASGAYHSCAIVRPLKNKNQQQGVVRCWGMDHHGQRSIPKQLQGKAATKLAAGDTHTCALFADGKLRCWGGKPPKARRSRPAYSSFALAKGELLQMAAGDGYTCISYRPKGSPSPKLRCWGPQPGSLRKLQKLAPKIRLLRASGPQLCAILDDGGLRCFQKSSKPKTRPLLATWSKGRWSTSFPKPRRSPQSTLSNLQKTSEGLELSKWSTQRLKQLQYMFIPHSEGSNSRVSIVDLSKLERGQHKQNLKAIREVRLPGGTNPSRTMVDRNKDAWIGMRGPQGGKSYVHVLSATGGIDSIALDFNGGVRALAMDRDGNVWAGGMGSRTLFKIHGPTRSPIKNGLKLDRNGGLELPSGVKICGYGAASDKDGDVWISSRCPDQFGLYKIEVRTHALVKLRPKNHKNPYLLPLGSIYGIGADRAGYIWASSYSSSGAHVGYRVHSKTFVMKGIYAKKGCEEGLCNGKGLSADKDGNVWMACTGFRKLLRFHKGSTKGECTGKTGNNTMGVSTDGKGHIWSVSFVEGKIYKNTLHRNSRHLGSFPACRGSCSPYTYSDMIGNQTPAHFKRTQGSWSFQHNAVCLQSGFSLKLRVSVGTNRRNQRCRSCWIRIRYKAARLRSGLSYATAYSKRLKLKARAGVQDLDWQPAAIAPASWFHFEITLESDDAKASPILQALTLRYPKDQRWGPHSPSCRPYGLR